ncbi:NAD-dependent epimerase/dehydratase family protein [Actinomyces qiguomingii]|uniref:NAD-dependent epimerase/dehydratase family protein n=1 Tax=Actinomyces qiguomingii TaxID=2057800 RepID=UPI000CA00101|nr:NAD-dependent epimerase/dehydratase family protein [Actinomyces qiguomingii]
MASAADLVIGCGPVGRSVVRVLTTRGQAVTAASRNRPHGFSDDWVRLDANNASAVARVAAGAERVYLCAAPPMVRWASEFEPLVSAVLAGLKEGTTLVFAGNLYPYGDQGIVISESSRELARGPKGRLRARLDQMVLSSRGLSTAVVRSSSFYGPGVGTSRAGRAEIEAMMAGKPVPALGSPDELHSMTYIDDFGRALVNVAHDRSSHGRVWLAPVQPAMSQRELLTAIGSGPGVKPKFRVANSFMLAAFGLVSPTMRSLRETYYIHAKPFLVDSSQYTEHFGDAATSLEDSVAQTLGALG